MESVSSEYCRAHDELPVASPPLRGHIASLTTVDTPHCDGTSHPWLIVAQPGQRVHLTLLDFAVDGGPGAVGGGYSLHGRATAPSASGAAVAKSAVQGLVEVCRQYGIIQDSGREKPVPICGRERRASTLYESLGNRVKVWLTATGSSALAGAAAAAAAATASAKDGRRFVIQYTGKSWGWCSCGDASRCPRRVGMMMYRVNLRSLV